MCMHVCNCVCVCALDCECALSSAQYVCACTNLLVWVFCICCVDLFDWPRLLFASPCALISMRFCIQAFVIWHWHCMLARHKRFEVCLCQSFSLNGVSYTTELKSPLHKWVAFRNTSKSDGSESCSASLQSMSGMTDIDIDPDGQPLLNGQRLKPKQCQLSVRKGKPAPLCGFQH